MSSTTLDAVLHNPRLPSLPAVAVELIEMTSQPDLDLRQIAALIETDQALSVKIIRTVNSSYYGLPRPCASINQAIVYLGLNSVKTLALGFCLVDSVDEDDGVGFDYASYWRHELYSAAAARLMASATEKVEDDTAFLAALVQDIGMPALYRAFRDVYLQVIDLARGKHANLLDIEQRAIKITHAEVGAALAERWNLPPELVACIRYHHESDQASSEHQTIVRIVELSQIAAEVTGTHEVDTLARFRELGESWFGFSREESDEILRKTEEAAGELAQLFRVDLGNRERVEELLARAEAQRNGSYGTSNDPRASGNGVRRLYGESALIDHAVSTSGESPAMNNVVGLFVCHCRRLKMAGSGSNHHKVQESEVVRDALHRSLTTCLGECNSIAPINDREIAFVTIGKDEDQLCRQAEELRRKVADVTVRLVGVSPTSAVHASIDMGVRLATCRVEPGTERPDREQYRRLLSAARELPIDDEKAVQAATVNQPGAPSVVQAA